MIDVRSNQEVLGYYMTERAFGFGFGVLVKTTYLDGSSRYNFITESLQLTKEYKTQRGMHKYVTERDWILLDEPILIEECRKRIL